MINSIDIEIRREPEAEGTKAKHIATVTYSAIADYEKTAPDVADLAAKRRLWHRLYGDIGYLLEALKNKVATSPFPADHEMWDELIKRFANPFDPLIPKGEEEKIENAG